MSTEKAKITDVSKGTWTTTPGGDGKHSNEIVKLSLMFRAVEAMEVMAQNHIKLQADCEFHRQRAQSRGEVIAGLNRSLATTKGHLTRAKHAVTQTKQYTEDKIAKIVARIEELAGQRFDPQPGLLGLLNDIKSNTL